MRYLFVIAMMLTSAFVPSLLAGDDAKLKEILAGDHRSEKNKARDVYRHPYETLKFFGVKDAMTIAEIWPGGGWYTEVLAPYLKDNGKLIAVTYDQNAETQKPWMARVNKNYEDNYRSKTDVYGVIELANGALNDTPKIAEDGSLDMILDFRNAHNWIQWGADQMVESWFNALKKGGVVGLVDHRMDEDKPYNPQNGYLHEKQVIEIMEKHGFKLAGRSDINANKKDTKDHPSGVWTLPPAMALKEKDQEKYKAIGESDRMTLKFIKP